jgi:hypothetical protein
MSRLALRIISQQRSISVALSRSTVCGEGLEISALGLDEGIRGVSLGNLAYAIPEGG